MRTDDARRFARLDELFQAALDQPPETREEWLDQQNEDPELLAEVRALLEEDAAGGASELDGIVGAHLGAESLPGLGIDPGVETVEGASAGETEASVQDTTIALSDTALEASRKRQRAAARALLPERIGPYRILGELGRGGLATVYRAEREGEFSMPVALKRIRRGMDTDDILERLRLERQILARLVHPNIARIHDGGSDGEGLPYLVMEIIEGERIDTWCVSRGLSARQRLDLFLQACGAVSFAHQNLILHRDLKPSNILVTEEGVVKLLDFGIAKVLTGDAEAAFAQTVTGVEKRLLTPDYASPEQFLGLPLTTASDLYSLGVLLYLLISGRLPHGGDGETSPISRFTGEPADPPTVSKAMRQERAARNELTAPEGRWLQEVRHDLDAVVAKALEHEPEQRYGSVRELAEDVRRLLSDRPVLARRQTFGTRLYKMARRHRTGFAVGALVTLSLLAAILVTSWMAAVADRERLRAERQWEGAESVADFLVELFEVSNPYAADTSPGAGVEALSPRGDSVTARELLDRAAERIDAGEQVDDLRHLRLRRAIARAYFNLSLYPQAREQLEAAEQSLEHLERDGSVDLEIARGAVDRDLGWLDIRGGQLGAGQTRLHRARQRFENLGSVARRELVETLEHFGELERARSAPELARIHYGEALALLQPLVGERSPSVARLRAGLAKTYQEEGRPEEANELFLDVLEVRRELLGEHHPLVLETLNDLAVTTLDAQGVEAAERIWRDLLQRQRQTLGAGHVDLAPTLFNLAYSLVKMKRSEEAEQLLLETWQLTEKGSTETILGAKILMLRGELLEQQGDAEGAVAYYRQTLELRRRLFGNENPFTVTALQRLAFLWARLGDARAEPLCREALRAPDLSLQDRASLYLALGVLALEAGRPEDAERDLSQGLEEVGEDVGWASGALLLRLAQAQEKLDRRREALRSATRATELLRAHLGPDRTWTKEADALRRKLGG